MMGTAGDMGTTSFVDAVRGDTSWGRSVRTTSPPLPEFRAVFEALPGLYLVVEPDAPRYTIAAVSDAYARGTQTRREALVGRSLFEGLPGRPADADQAGGQALRRSLARVVQTAEADAVAVASYEVRRPAEAGGGVEVRGWSVRIAPVLGRAGEVVYLILGIEDVTEIVGLAPGAAPGGELAARAQQLHEANRELGRARQAAEAASDARSELLMSMGHELRTPLQAILGFAELIEDDPRQPLGDRQRERLRCILRSGEHLHRLVDDVFDLSRIEAGRLSIELAPIDVARTMGDVMATLGAMAERAGIALIAPAVPPELPRVIADRTRIAQVLINLGTNAIKYGRAHGHVELRVVRQGGMLRIAVVDDGVGVAAEQCARVFEPFHRAGQELGAIEGTGIGLTIAKRLVELMGGEIGFTSELGRGSESWITLPVEATARGDVPVAARATRAGRRRATGTARHKVVYVEDDLGNLAFMRDLVSGLPDVELFTARTAELGLELVRAHRPSAVILDVGLPGMSGLDAMTRLRASSAARDIPVIGLSAGGLPPEAGAARAGFSRYFTKPVTVTELTTALDELLA
jgi:signal transduction histidine kinase